MKAATTILLAAALGSASPVTMQARDGQCDCSKSFYGSAGYWDEVCPTGYENISKASIAGISCAQVGCSLQNFEDQCKTNKATPAPTTSTATTTPVAACTPAAAEQPPEKAQDDGCDCSKSFYGDTDYWDTVCPAGYKNISKVSIAGITCAQPNCSAGEYEAQCGVRP